ncbi:hypothetical protein Daus18300_001782 [Diaporthe australafricana]|uniref:Uncharacterized protein n=1 Tax=Diaporthe australafricana TaxID=127596 RepID=A0ABR3XT80_9PEZI
MFAYRITDEMREHMFDNWSERQLQKMADYEDYTVPELKERLLEFAAFHDFDTLDDFIRPAKVTNTIMQFDGALGSLVDHDRDGLNAPKTPTMGSPRSHISDDFESVFDNSDASLLTTPSSQYTPAKQTTELVPVVVGRRASSTRPVPFRPAFYNFVNIGAGSAVHISNSELSLEFERVPDYLPLAYNHEKRVLHLTGADFSTGMAKADTESLVIFIKGVTYGDHQTGSAVFLHPTSQWNTVTCFDDTVPPPKESATLEALWLALHMISSTSAMDPSLRKVRILCADDDIENALEKHRLCELIQPADRQPLSEINRFWEDITNGVNDERRLDLRLWKVTEETMQPFTDEANCYMYKKNGRDWVKENGKGQDQLKDLSTKYSSPEKLASLKKLASPENSENLASYLALAADAKATLMANLEQNSIQAPPEVLNMGPQAVSRWTAEARARVQQNILHAIVAPEIYRNMGDMARRPSTYEEAQDADSWFRSYEKAAKIMADREQAQWNVDDWVNNQADIRASYYEQDQDMAGGSVQNDDVGETESELVKQVLEMDWE